MLDAIGQLLVSGLPQTFGLEAHHEFLTRHSQLPIACFDLEKVPDASGTRTIGYSRMHGSDIRSSGHVDEPIQQSTADGNRRVKRVLGPFASRILEVRRAEKTVTNDFIQQPLVIR